MNERTLEDRQKSLIYTINRRGPKRLPWGTPHLMSFKVLSFILFAVDSNVFFSHDNPNTLVNTVNYELEKLTEWIRANKLSLNLQKTKYMLSSNTLEALPLNIILDDTPLESVPEIKFLGITVDNKLSWKPHIASTCNTISRNIGVINRLKSHIPSSSLLTLYSSLILPYLNYGILAWGNTHKFLLDRLLLLQKKKSLGVFSIQMHVLIQIYCFLIIRFWKLQICTHFSLANLCTIIITILSQVRLIECFQKISPFTIILRDDPMNFISLG